MLRKLIKYKRFLLFILPVIAVFGFSLLMYGRVGGGQGYSGGSSGGSGGGGGGEIVYILIRLIIRYPKVGIPVAIIVVAAMIISRRKNPTPTRTYSSLKPAAPAQPLDSRSRDILIDRLQQEDPNFSLPLFIDFAQLLYVNVMDFTGRQKLDKLRVYLAQPVLEQLQMNNRFVTGIRDVIIGSVSFMSISSHLPEENCITLTFETNYTVSTGSEQKPVTYYEYSSWTLARKKGVVSKGPGEVNRIGCTQCGAPHGDNLEGKCLYCGHDFVEGADTWYVKTIGSLEREVRTPVLDSGYTAEQGTDRPTLYQADLQTRLAAFKEKYPGFDLPSFYDKAKHIFKALQEAWTRQQWELVRPYESDNLFQSHLYWINLYKKERMRNVLRDIEITGIELVKVRHDRFYDALTVRVYASMIDYTETYEGKHTGGNKKRPRPFSEYWTFIRSTGQTGDTEVDRCPNCGNELKIGMAGKCQYCGSKITGGEFGWVLSLIEQDESYTG